jgi:hypothetical protein
LFFTILLPKTRLPRLSNAAGPSITGTAIAHGPVAQATLLCAAAIQYSAIGSIYFAVLFVSLQFIVIVNSNSKYTWEQYYRQLCISYQNTIHAAITKHEWQILLQSKRSASHDSL